MAGSRRVVDAYKGLSRLTVISAVARRPKAACAEAGIGMGMNGRLQEAPEGARWSLNECTAAGRAAAEVGACA